MARRTFTVIDVVEILAHWYAGRSKKQVAASLGVDRSTVAKYVGPALAAGLVPGGPAISEDHWRAMVRVWFPGLAGTKLCRPSWPEIDRHRERIDALVGVVPASVIHQRLVDEQGLEASVASCAATCGRISLTKCAGARWSSGARRSTLATKLRSTTATWAPGPTRPPGGTGASGLSPWCWPTPGTCSSTRWPLWTSRPGWTPMWPPLSSSGPARPGWCSTTYAPGS